MIHFFQSQFNHAGIPPIARLVTNTRMDKTRSGHLGRGQVFLLALVMFLRIASPSWAHPIGAPGTKPCEEDLNKAIDNGATTFEVMEELSPKQKANILRGVGVKHARCIDRMIAAAETFEYSTWQQNARQRFVPELIWVRDMIGGGIEEIYRQAAIYRASENKWYAGDIIAIVLHHWAVEEKYPPAIYDVAQESIENGDGSSYALILQDLANDKYVPAMLNAGKRFLNGDGVEKNLGTAYYWIKRAEAAHGDVPSILKKPHERLFEEMTALEIARFGFMLVRYGDLDWTNIEMPDFEWPPIETPP